MHNGGRGFGDKRMFAYKGEGIQAKFACVIPPMQKTTLAIVYLHSRTVYRCQHANIMNASGLEDLEHGLSFVAIHRTEPLCLSYDMIE